MVVALAALSELYVLYQTADHPYTALEQLHSLAAVDASQDSAHSAADAVCWTASAAL